MTIYCSNVSIVSVPQKASPKKYLAMVYGFIYALELSGL